MVDTRWFAIATVFNYALLTGLWAVILVMYLRYRRLARGPDHLVAVLAGVLALDAFRSFVENLYFGIVWAGRYGIAFTAIEPTLSAPWFLLLPKLLNLAVALVIVGVVLARFIPESLAARRASAQVLQDSLARLRSEEQRWQLSVEAAAHGIWDVNLETGAVWLSPALEAQLGAGPGELASSVSSDRWLDRVHPDDRPRLVALRREFMAGRSQTFEAEFRLGTRDGRWRRILSRGAAWRDPETARVTRLVGVHEDVTERREAEHALAARTRMESLGVLAGGIAHDFNNLLAIIRGNAHLARTSAPSRAAEALDDLDHAVSRAAELTSRLLAYSGRGRFVVTPLDFSAHGRELLRLLGPSIPANIRVESSFAEGLPAVEADAAQVQQLFMNLVANAVEAIGPRPGVIRVSTSARDATRDAGDFVPGSEPIAPGPHVVLEVADDGSGMTDEVRARIFEPFFSSKGSGRGMGLAAMLGILQGHGAALELRTAPGDGSRFTLWFPASGAGSPPLLAASHTAGPGGLRRALVADDEELLRKLVSTILTTAGYAVDTARDGAEAVRRLQECVEPYGLVVLDITMPVLDGRAVLAALRAAHPAVPVVLMSGYAAEAAPLDPHTRFLQKPFTAAALRRAIAEACPPSS